MATEKKIRYRKEYYQNNKEKILLKRKEYQETNKEKIKIRKRKNYEKNKKKILIKNKERYKNNKEKYLINQREYNKTHKKERSEYNYQYQKNRLKTDINYKIICSLRDRLRKAIRFNQKSGSAVKDLGCSISELKLHLESKFQFGMSWDNYGYNGWHIDHIKPLSRFNLQNREDFLKANNYTNLQPLWAEDNLKKGSK